MPQTPHSHSTVTISNEEKAREKNVVNNLFDSHKNVCIFYFSKSKVISYYLFILLLCAYFLFLSYLFTEKGYLPLRRMEIKIKQILFGLCITHFELFFNVQGNCLNKTEGVYVNYFIDSPLYSEASVLNYSPWFSSVLTLKTINNNI